MKKLVIFDLDGTLLNSAQDIAICCNKALASQGFATHDHQQYRFFVGGGMQLLLERTIPKQHHGSPQFAAALAFFKKEYTAYCAEKSTFYPGAKELLQRLHDKGIITAIATNKPDGMSQIIANKFLAGLIDITYGQRDDIPKKPDPAVLHRIMQETAIAPEDVLYTGDSDVDIYTGLNAGVTTVGVLWGFRPKEELVGAGATLLANSFEELEKLILA